MTLRILDEPKVDAHVHVLDPERFPYGADTHYRPAGQEIATADQLFQVMDTYGVQHALIVGPNSGYELDNRCMLDAVARSGGRCKGIAVVRNDTGVAELEALRANGVIGVAWNATRHGVPFYAGASALLARLVALDMFIQVQVEHDQLAALAPMLERSGARILIDHCGRPTPGAGIDQPGFRAVLALAATRRAFVKLSGIVKFTREPFPHPDARPYIDALLEAYTPEGCVWASDWPYLRAPSRIDYGVLLDLAAQLMPDAAVRRRVMWETPRALFGFGA
jgi:predicted TIM-barrel fold metal-dependent hydrolase